MIAHLSTTLRHSKKRGFTLIELAIVLGVVGIMAAGLWRLMSSGGQQSKDLATAQQQQQLITAVQGFLADTSTGGGQPWMTTLAANANAVLPLPTSNTSLANCQASISATYKNFCNFLPTGFSSGTTTTPYGQSFLNSIRVLKDGSAVNVAPSSYSFMIVTSGGTVIPDTDGGRISGLIGGDGGFIYTSTVACGATSPTACGSMGAWSTNVVTTYGYTAASVAAGLVASRTFITPGTNNSYSWLARIAMPGDTTSYTDNTMSTNMYMSAGTTLNLFPYNSTGTNSLQLSNGSIQGSGSANGTTAQIFLSNGTSATYSADGVPLIQLVAGCSELDAAPPSPCPAAMLITHGDLFLSNGQVQAQKLYSASDARLKMNIRPIEDPLGNVMKIDAVAFAFKKGGSESMGVTAQQLEKVYPQLVSENNGTKYVEYNGLIGPLIGAVQELKRDNDALRLQLKDQSEREDRLEHALTQRKTAP